MCIVLFLNFSFFFFNQEYRVDCYRDTSKQHRILVTKQHLAQVSGRGRDRYFSMDSSKHRVSLEEYVHQVCWSAKSAEEGESAYLVSRGDVITMGHIPVYPVYEECTVPCHSPLPSFYRCHPSATFSFRNTTASPINGGENFENSNEMDEPVGGGG